MASGTILFGNGNQIQDTWRSMEAARDAITKLNGVSKVEINHVTHMFYVEYNPEKISFENIRKEVRSYAK